MDMGKGIELAKVKVEKEYETKKNAGGTKIPRPAWGMSPDEISKLIDRLEHYEGKTLNMKKAQKMVRLSELAKWLLDNSMDVVAIDVERIHPSHLYVMAWVELKRLTSLDGAELEAFKEMTNLADHIFFSGTADDVIRASFAIQRVWNEPFNN